MASSGVLMTINAFYPFSKRFFFAQSFSPLNLTQNVQHMLAFAKLRQIKFILFPLPGLILIFTNLLACDSALKISEAHTIASCRTRPNPRSIGANLLVSIPFWSAVA